MRRLVVLWRAWRDARERDRWDFTPRPPIRDPYDPWGWRR